MIRSTSTSGRTSKEGVSRAAYASGSRRSDPDRHGRRAVWIAALITIIGAGIDLRRQGGRGPQRVRPLAASGPGDVHGTNIYDKYDFPNPPIMPLTLYPLMALPPVEGAMVWFGAEGGAGGGGAVLICLRMVRLGDRPVPSWVQAMVVLLSLRPIMSDLSPRQQ